MFIRFEKEDFPNVSHVNGGIGPGIDTVCVDVSKARKLIKSIDQRWVGIDLGESAYVISIPQDKNYDVELVFIQLVAIAATPVDEVHDRSNIPWQVVLNASIGVNKDDFQMQ